MANMISVTLKKEGDATVSGTALLTVDSIVKVTANADDANDSDIEYAIAKSGTISKKIYVVDETVATILADANAPLA